MNREVVASDQTGTGKYEQLLARCHSFEPVPTAVAYPCELTALAGAIDAAAIGLIAPILVGPAARIRDVAERHRLDLGRTRMVDARDSHVAAVKAVELVRQGKAELLMKGSLHTDELLAAVVARETGLRTRRRITHAFIMDVPAYHKILVVTDAAINIAPTLDDKIDICQNAIDLVVSLGPARPKVAILAAVETINSRMVATLDAAALCKMAERGQITRGVLDGPLAFDNAISKEAARIKGIVSEVAGDPDILLVPDLESGNMLAKQLTFLAHADSAGIVLGARVPIILTSRADSVRSRIASCAVAALTAHAPSGGPERLDARTDRMKTRTKIVATIGPASSTPQRLRELVTAGVDVFRLNFSHGTHEQHSAVVGHIRATSRELERHVAILQDLCGPKMRLEPVAGDLLECRLDDEFTMVSDAGALSSRELACTYRDLPNDLKAGETVLFADGAVAMIVTATEPGRARLRVTLPGRLRSRQGINLPGSDVAVDSLTDKDLGDLDWTARHAADIDFVGLSFARRAEDVDRLRQELRARNCSSLVVVKIEKPQAVERLDAIVAAADAVMVARGDLGVEMDVHRVPAIQKQIVTTCNRAHRPVIVATQMLNSMEHSNRPTRAEAGDVFNAVLDGADAVMLSGESAVGEYPVEAVTTMRQICQEAEAVMKASGGRPPGSTAPLSTVIDPITAASADAACMMTQQIDAALIAVVDDSGRTALAVSSRRPAALVVALLRTEQVARSLSLCWGVTAVVLNEVTWAERVLAFGVEWAKSHGLVTSGQRAVLLRGELADRPDVRAVVAGPID